MDYHWAISEDERGNWHIVTLPLLPGERLVTKCERYTDGQRMLGEVAHQIWNLGVDPMDGATLKAAMLAVR